MAHPTFIIIGAMKGGTTSLYRYVAAHPEVSVSTEKETNYFLGGDAYQRGSGWYSSLFDERAKARGEASPNYTKRHLFSGVPARMAQLSPGARLIYMVRDPIPRIVSHYVHNRAHGREARTFSEAIAEDPKYVQTSMYAYQLDAFCDHFPLDQILILDSDELRREAAIALTRIFEFIGVDPSFEVPNVDERFHSSSEKRRKSILEQHVPHRRLREAVRRFLPEQLTERQPLDRPTPSGDDTKRLADTLGPDIARFRALSELSLSNWSV